MKLPLLEHHAKSIFAVTLLAYVALYALLCYLTFDAVRMIQDATVGSGANYLVQTLCAEQSCTDMKLQLEPLPRSSKLQLTAEVSTKGKLAVNLLQQRYRSFKETVPWHARQYLADDMQLTRAPDSINHGGQPIRTKKKGTHD